MKDVYEQWKKIYQKEKGKAKNNEVNPLFPAMITLRITNEMNERIIRVVAAEIDYYSRSHFMRKAIEKELRKAEKAIPCGFEKPEGELTPKVTKQQGQKRGEKT